MAFFIQSKRIVRLVPYILVSLVLAFPPEAVSQSSPSALLQRSPIVVLLHDTTASMQWRPGAKTGENNNCGLSRYWENQANLIACDMAEGVPCRPACSDDGDCASGRCDQTLGLCGDEMSRNILVMEALAGDLESYRLASPMDPGFLDPAGNSLTGTGSILEPRDGADCTTMGNYFPFFSGRDETSGSFFVHKDAAELVYAPLDVLSNKDGRDYPSGVAGGGILGLYEPLRCNEEACDLAAFNPADPDNPPCFPCFDPNAPSCVCVNLGYHKPSCNNEFAYHMPGDAACTLHPDTECPFCIDPDYPERICRYVSHDPAKVLGQWEGVQSGWLSGSIFKMEPDYASNNLKPAESVMMTTAAGGVDDKVHILSQAFADIRTDLFAEPTLWGTTNDGGKPVDLEDCRGRSVVFITDGENLNGDINPLSSAIDQLSKGFPINVNTGAMKVTSMKTYIIGVGERPEPDTDPSEWEGIPKTLNDLAIAGLTEHAYFGSTTSEIRSILSEIMNNITQGNATGASPATTTRVENEYGEVDPQAIQYSYFASSQIPSDSILWKGHLEQVIYEVKQTTYGEVDYGQPTPASVCDFGEILNKEPLQDPQCKNPHILSKQNGRNIYTTVARKEGGTFSWKVVPLKKEFIVDTDLAVSNDSTSCSLACQAVIAFVRAEQDLREWANGTSDPAQALNIIETSGFLRADRYVRNAVLGDPWRTGPLVVGAPSLDLPLLSYQKFRSSKVRQRPTIVYLSANDGMVHAFNALSGKEEWAFIPPHILSMVRLQGRGHTFLLDGPCAVRDIQLCNPVSDGSQCKDSPINGRNVSVENDAYGLWRTVLICGHGEGGMSYFALDVTTPTSSVPSEVDWPGLSADDGVASFRFMWEFDRDQDTTTEGAGGGLGYSDAMRFSFATPGMGSVVLDATDPAFPGLERAVAYFPTGVEPEALGLSRDDCMRYGHSSYSTASKCKERAGQNKDSEATFFVLDLSSGLKLVEDDWFRDGTGVGGGNCNQGHCLSNTAAVGSPSAYSEYPGEFLNKIFFGTENGRLARVDLSSTKRADWRVDPAFFSAYTDDECKREGCPPIYGAPGLAFDANGRLVLIVGSGDLLNLSDERNNRIFSLTEHTYVDPNTGRTMVSECKDEPDQSTEPVTSRDPECTTSCYCVNWKLSNGDEGDRAVGVVAPGRSNGQLVQGEKLLGMPVVFDDAVYFTTYAPASEEVTKGWRDDCIFGGAVLWGIEFDRMAMMGAKASENLIPRLSIGETVILDYYLGDNTLSYGPALVVRPAYYGVEEGEESTRKVKQGAPSKVDLVVHTGTTPSVQGDSTSSTKPKANSINFSLPTPPSRSHVSSWGTLIR